MGQGELTPEEAASVVTVLEIRRKALETVEIERRVAALGVEEESMDESSPITTSDHPLFIGGDQTQGQFFHGRIDEVRVFNGARTAAEVLSDMNTPVGSKVESLLRRHYSLESKLKRRRSTGVRAEIY